jgi:hypothetical protein
MHIKRHARSDMPATPPLTGSTSTSAFVVSTSARSLVLLLHFGLLLAHLYVRLVSDSLYLA